MRMAGNINLTADTKLSDAVSANPFLLLLLEHFDIELPLQEKTLREVSAEHQISPDLLLTFANLYIDLYYVIDTHFSSDDISDIIRYLKNSHRYYSEEIYPRILNTIGEMSQPGNRQETVMINKFFDEYFSEVKVHLDYENKTVFPYILTCMRGCQGYPARAASVTTQLLSTGSIMMILRRSLTILRTS